MLRLSVHVEAVGIEPTSGGQSPQAPTSVAYVLLSPAGYPQAGGWARRRRTAIPASRA